MNTSELQFNIIFTPHTVRYLGPFVHSLLKWSTCDYRIVNNGCGSDEQKLLQELCATSDRLEYLNMSEDEMIQHGIALNWLLERTASPWFCFIDSDILATGPFLEDIAAELENADVFSTGHPLWHSPADIVLPPSFQRLHGIHFATTDDKVLSGTYFAVYRKEVLEEAMQSTGVDLRIYRWDDVPERHHAALRQAGLVKLEYDTGMLLTSLMYAQNVRFAVRDLEQICHLGGFSSRAGDEPAYYYRGTIDRIAVRFLGGLFSTPLLYLADCWYAIRRPSPGVSAAESRSMPFAERRLLEGRIRKRRNTARYFKAVMNHFMAGETPPPVPALGHGPAEDRLAKGAHALISLYQEHPPVGT